MAAPATGLRSAALKSCFHLPSSVAPLRPITRLRYKPPIVFASYGVFRGDGADRCLIAPLEPRSPAGKLLNRILLDDRENLPAAATNELERLSSQRDEAVVALSKMNLSSDEALLYRRIAELKQEECRIGVEDVIYALILDKFLEMRVHLVPRLSQCLCGNNNRLEIWPRKDFELESVHSVEVLEMVREHVNSTPGYRANCTAKESWCTTQIHCSRLHHLYTSSVFHGYLLKSASLRYALESSLLITNDHSAPLSLISNYIGFGRVQSSSSSAAALWGCGYGGDLRGYVMGMERETVEMCGRVRSVEGAEVVRRHCGALFDDGGAVVDASFGSVKRLLLEAVAFGCFLWDAERCADSVCTLEQEDNQP